MRCQLPDLRVRKRCMLPLCMRTCCLLAAHARGAQVSLVRCARDMAAKRVAADAGAAVVGKAPDSVLDVPNRVLEVSDRLRAYVLHEVRQRDQRVFWPRRAWLGQAQQVEPVQQKGIKGSQLSSWMGGQCSTTASTTLRLNSFWIAFFTFSTWAVR